MSDMTPEKLRKLHKDGKLAVLHVLDAADAWEADIKASDEYARLWHRDAKRLEAAEKLIEDYFECEDTTVLCEAQAVLRGTALAAKEEKQDRPTAPDVVPWDGLAAP